MSISLGLWLSSCIEETESPQIELTDHSKIATIKTWFEENESSLRVSKSGANYRTGDQELILPFFEKEPDWSMFTEYSFPDGRKVFEIHIKKLSGLVPKDFFEKYGSSTSDLTEESLLFVEHANSDVGFSVWVARYFSYGNKSKDMTYNKIPHNWSGRIDLFTFSEQHLRSFEVEDGRIIKTLEYMTGDENKRFSPAIMLMGCDVIWIDFPYYGIPGGVGSSQSVRVVSCYNTEDRSGGAFNDFKDPDPLKPGGGNGNGVRLPEPVVCDNTNNFGSDCIPFPREMRFEIDLSKLNKCHQDLIKQLIGSSQEDFKRIFNKFKGKSVVPVNFNVKFEYGNCSGSGATACVKSGLISADNWLTIQINFKPEYENRTELAFASTILHEMLHAYLIFDNQYQTGDCDMNCLLYEYIRKYSSPEDVKKGNVNAPHHAYFAETNFLNQIGTELKNFGRAKGYNFADNFYQDMAWGGLLETDAFLKGKSDTDRKRILNRVGAELYNKPYSGTNPLGKRACY